MNQPKEYLQVPSDRPPNTSPMMGQVQRNEPDELGLGELLSTIWRGKWIVLLCVFLVLAATWYYVYQVAVPKYRATAHVVLQVRDQQVVDLDSVISGVSRESSAINTELGIITSRAMIERLVRDLGLDETPEFNPFLRDVPAYYPSEILAFFKENIFGMEPSDFVPSEEDNMRATINQVMRAIEVTAQPDTYLIDISATSEFRRRSAEMANQLAALYIDDQIDTKFSAVEYAVDWLSSRVIELEDEVREKDEEIKDVLGESEFISAEGLAALNIRMKKMRSGLTEAEADVVQAEEKLAELERLLEQEDFTELSVVLNDPIMKRLLRTEGGMTDENRAALLSQANSRIGIARSDLQTAESRRVALEASFDTLSLQRDSQTEDLERINKLTHEAESTRTLYQTFLDRLKETSLQIGLQQADSRILSPAVPGLQIEPREKRSLIMAAILGTLFGAILVVVRQRFDTGLKSAERLAQISGLSVLAELPVIPIKSRDQLIPYFIDNPTSHAAEAVRNLRTSVMMSNIDSPPQVIMVTSSVPGEGKTSTSVSLAMNFARLNKRTLLLECDIRRRTLGEYFSADLTVDLSHILTEEVSAKDAISHDERTGMDFLLAKKSTVNAADMFSSERFGDFLERMRKEYDYIIIDTPPVTVVPDARIIARHCDARLFAVKWNSTPERIVQDGIGMFASIGLNVSGTVMTLFDPRAKSKYGYGSYQSYAKYGKAYYNQ